MPSPASSPSTPGWPSGRGRTGGGGRPKALADLGLDIRHATVQSLGEDVVDTFYVRNAAGGLVSDAFHRGEIQRAVLHAVS